MADERLTFDIFANADRAVAGFAAAGRGAKATADEVKRLSDRITALKEKSATVKIGVDDAAAKAKLDRLNLQLLRTGRKVTADVNVEGAVRAAVELSAVNAELDKFQRKSKEGLFTRLLGTGPGGGGLLGQLFGGGPAAGGGGLASLAVAVPAVEALLPEVLGLASGLAAATAGVGAFGLLALPTFEKVKNAYAGITAAQQAYTRAQQLEKTDPTKAHAAAAALALEKLKATEQGMDTPTRTIITGIQGLVTQFDAMATALQPDILKVFNQGLKIASELLPALLPLAQAASGAISGLLGSLVKFFQLSTVSEPPGWKPGEKLVKTLTPFGEFMKTLTSLVGPSITAIGQGLGHVAVALGKLFTVMSKKDVVHAINILFDAMVLAIDAVIIIVKRLMNNWDSLSNAFRTVRHDVAHWLDLMRQDFEDFRHWVYSDFILRIVRFFTSTLPTAFDIWKENVRITWDKIKVLFLEGVLAITTTMGHLPGPLGAPFRQASKDIRRELDKIQGDAANAAANIQADWDKLHGKTVVLGFDLSTSAGGIFPTPTGRPRPAPFTTTGHAAGTPGAPPGWGWVGEKGPELVRFKGGETVIPNHALPGYAGGAGWNFTDAFHPSVLAFGGWLSSAFQAAENAVIAANRSAMLSRLLSALGTGAGAGAAIGGGARRWAGAVSAVLQMLEGPGQQPGDLGIVLSQMTTESGGNPYAVNLSDSNARAGHPSTGLMQVIAGTYASYGAPRWGYPPPVAYGVSENPMANIYAGLNYAIARYGPNWRNVLGHGHGYDSGHGILPPGLSLSWNGTGRPEPMVATRGGPAVKIVIGGSGHGSLDQALLTWIKRNVRVEGGGSVQVAFGT